LRVGVSSIRKEIIQNKSAILYDNLERAFEQSVSKGDKAVFDLDGINRKKRNFGEIKIIVRGDG
jgi:predicted kinase